MREELSKILVDLEFIENNCISFRHDFGLLTEQHRDQLRFQYKEWVRAMLNNGLHNRIEHLLEERAQERYEEAITNLRSRGLGTMIDEQALRIASGIKTGEGE